MLVALNIPDCHRPFHDKKSYSLMIRVAKDLLKKHGKIDEINICGDYADFYGLSLHDKLPESISIKQRLEDEISDVRSGLKELRELFQLSVINYIAGNHEYRFNRYMIKNCKEMYSFTTVPDLLGLDECDIRYHKYGRNQLYRMFCNSNTYIRHMPYNCGKNCASGTAHKKAINISFGHTHRRQSYTFRNGKKEIITCNSLGWLGDPSSPVFSYADHDDWSQGFEVCYMENKIVHREYVEILNHKCFYNGILYK